ncbi:MAG: DinB family protein [Gemmatimonadaceae bacterium]
MQSMLLTRWSETGEKIVQLAQAVPAEQYEYRATPEVRSVAEQLRHVAFWNTYVAGTLDGKPVDGEANELPRAQFSTKAKIVAALERSFNDAAMAFKRRKEAVDEESANTMVSFIAHNAEHYGQLTVYARLNGLVPPASR